MKRRVLRLLNRQFLLARLRRAFLQDSPTPGGSLRFAHRGLISFNASGVQTSSPKGQAPQRHFRFGPLGWLNDYIRSADEKIQVQGEDSGR